ncbi:MAPEG family protein [Aestuariibacter sp. AA17]|uniref:MAPEG family protein n=1 Tax=Fluctibacter corallii TaxID=2984329 RepID=A0ABT3ADR4_9ALTE|nr:MAPEG family protein [Aestuariibacter sp. AA17]MCV2886381.1 MAPEG family protein [Aestuariibacter sp. AA17]
MNATIIALIGYIGWTLVLLVWLATFRTLSVFNQSHPSLRFAPDGSDVSSFGYRLTRAFMNCIESFAFIGGLLLLAIATDSMAITNGLAFVLLGARIGQSICHLISSSALFIQIRFVFFLIQSIICMYWTYTLLMRFI